jgi:hypothetical protein
MDELRETDIFAYPSIDFCPVDFFLGSCIKNKVSSTKMTLLQKLKVRISEDRAAVSLDTLGQRSNSSIAQLHT